MSTEFGFVYALTNPSMPGQVKIGMTRRRPEARMAELSSATGVPERFKLIYSRGFENAQLAERLIHVALEQLGCRTTSGREFFRLTPDEAIAAIDTAAQKLTQQASLEQDIALFSRRAQVLLSEERPSLKQQEQALSYFEFAGEMGSLPDQFNAALVAHDIAVARGPSSARGEEFAQKAHALYQACISAGVVRGHSQQAFLFVEQGAQSEGRAAWEKYWQAMPSDAVPEHELAYIAGTLQTMMTCQKKFKGWLMPLRKYRTQLLKELHRRAPDDKALPAWLKLETMRCHERILERYKLQLLGGGALGAMYLANPALFFTVLVGAGLLSTIWFFFGGRFFKRRTVKKNSRSSSPRRH